MVEKHYETGRKTMPVIARSFEVDEGDAAISDHAKAVKHEFTGIKGIKGIILKQD